MILFPLTSVEFLSIGFLSVGSPPFPFFLLPSERNGLGAVDGMACRSGFVIMLPTAFCFGELVSFTEENLGFLDQEKLHTPLYLSINMFAGKRGGLWIVGTGAVEFASIGLLVFQGLENRTD